MNADELERINNTKWRDMPSFCRSDQDIWTKLHGDRAEFLSIIKRTILKYAPNLPVSLSILDTLDQMTPNQMRHVIMGDRQFADDLVLQNWDEFRWPAKQ